jgi:hypothetical protein
MSVFTALLGDAYPWLADGWSSTKGADRCVIADHYRSDRPETLVLSSAVNIVNASGERPSLIARLRPEHPAPPPHRNQYDERVFDGVTEACAFAWAWSAGDLGVPRFSQVEGTPDLVTDTGWWIESKALHASDKDKALVRALLETGEVTSGAVTEPGAGLQMKARSALENAAQKRSRQKTGRLAVFFNLTSVDLPQLAIKEAVVGDLFASLCSAGAELSINRIALCYGYAWQEALSQ